MIKVDYLIIGSGIVGLTIARELRHRYPSATILICDKESGPAFHASGRNSGVLHAGFYYTADSLKAKFTLLGNQLMTEYCLERGLPINKIGKLVVAKNEKELPQLNELVTRARVNGVPIEVIDEQSAKEIEPRVKTFKQALWSPRTASVDPIVIAQTLVNELSAAKVQFLFENAYIGRKNGRVVLQKNEIDAGTVINAAGLYADKIARDFEVGLEYRILPFKGLYIYSNEQPGAFRTNIYPVPDLRNPFLGVHFTVTVDGRAKIGPTAIPALWREQYEGFSRFKLGEAGEIAGRQSKLFFSAGFDFRSLAFEEIQKYSRAKMVKLASCLASGVEKGQFTKWGRPGIRAQLLDVNTGKLEMDFKVLRAKNSLHVVNAVSPAFTCSMAFAKHACDLLENT